MFRELFNVPVTVEHRTQPMQDLAPPGVAPQPKPAAETTTEVQRQGAFITVQSLVSFPGATAAVTVIVNVASWAVPAWRGKPLLFVAAAVLVGFTIYLINQSDPLKTPGTSKQRIVEVVIALFNTLVLLSAAVGADAILRSSGAPIAPAQHVEVNRG